MGIVLCQCKLHMSKFDCSGLSYLGTLQGMEWCLRSIPHGWLFFLSKGSTAKVTRLDLDRETEAKLELYHREVVPDSRPYEILRLNVDATRKYINFGDDQ